MDIGGPNTNWDLSSLAGETSAISFALALDGSDSQFSNSDLVQFTENIVVTGKR